MLVIAAPGQGAQTPGFLTPWLDLPGVADRLAGWSELAGCDLVRYGTTADADEIRDTAIAQPLLVAAGLAAAEAVFGGLGQLPGRAQVAAGHSVGELTAGALAGVISAADALRLVRVRASAMAAAAAAAPTGMTAVLGGDEEQVLAAIEAHGLTAANVNGAGQIVAAGTLEELAAFAADPPPGARLRPLQVAGAFHTRHMSPAVEALRAAAAGVAVSSPAMTVLCNADGEPAQSGADWLERIINQVSAPVRWDLCMQTMAAMGVTAIIELPPAGTLTGLARRALRGVDLVALKTPGDLPAALALAAEHGPAQGAASREDTAGSAEEHHPGADSHHPQWRLLVAPQPGTFRAGTSGGRAVPPGSVVAAGTELGLIEARTDRHPVTPPYAGAILEWLVEDGDPVSAGQPIVRLQPDSSQQEAV
jgi:[acyl-carrier-protein] S-malonyltransferase